jgi:hypothetical protein
MLRGKPAHRNQVHRHPLHEVDVGYAEAVHLYGADADDGQARPVRQCGKTGGSSGKMTEVV